MNDWDALRQTLEKAQAEQNIEARRRLLIDAQEVLFRLFDQATKQMLKGGAAISSQVPS